MTLAAQLRRSIRANRRAIIRTLPYEPPDLLAMRRSFERDMAARGLGGLAAHVSSTPAAARICVAMRLLTLRHDRSIAYLPTTGAP